MKIKIETKLLTNWTIERRKDMEILNVILKKCKSISDSPLRADLESNIIEWVLSHSKMIKTMEEVQKGGVE